MHDEIVFEFPEEICVQKRVAIRKLNEKIDAESKKSQKFANAQKIFKCSCLQNRYKRHRLDMNDHSVL